MVCLELVPSDVQMCPEFLPSGGSMVSPDLGVKPQTFAVSVTVPNSGTSGVVCSSWWIHWLTTGMKPQTLAVLQFLKMVCPEFVPSDVQTCPDFLPCGFVVWLTSGVKPQTLSASVTAHKGSAEPE